MAVDLTTDFCGVSFKNPMIVPAGVHGRSGEVIREISSYGPAGICTKTIVSQPASDVLPCFSQVSSGMINSVFGSDKTSEYWFTEGIAEAKKGDSLVIANLAGVTPDEAGELAARAEGAGADMIMLPTHCPHMGEILSAMFPGMPNPEPKLTDVGPMQESVTRIKEQVKIPLVVKLSGTFSHIVKIWAKGVAEAGADGIACSDALGPALSIDIRTGEPALGGPRGVGGLTGPAIMPITLRMVLEAAMESGLPVIGVGGVQSASDMVQYFMAGASLVGVCTAGHVRGPEQYRKILTDLERLLEELGASSPAELRGRTIERIRQREQKGHQAVTEKIVPAVDSTACTGCGICKRVCAYGAVRIVEKKAVIDGNKCIGCGLCVSACPERALSQVYYPA